MLHHYLLSSASLFLAQSDTIRSEEITWLERQSRNDPIGFCEGDSN